jgi:hypothetical protein
MDATVLGRERRESPRSFFELPLASHAVAAAGLIPGDGDVHEPLEEVALVCDRRTPRIFERFVRLEVLAGADQVEAVAEPLRRRP